MTVRLFSTRPVDTVEFVGNRARVRMCAACPAQALAGSLKVGAAGCGRVTAAGRVVERVFVDGEVKATVNDGRVAQVAGRWSVAAAGDGLRVRVEVPSERYVMAVVQAEAASGEPVESLKALAVVARSFAMRNAQRYGPEGLCDSTLCQALRFAPVPGRVREAVEATAGETLWIGEGAGARQVSGYFAQDCGGRTEDAAALWGGPKQPWLTAHPDPFCAREPALWHAELSVEQVRDALRGEGFRVPERLLAVRVAKTDGGNRAAELAMEGPAHTVVWVKAATLRFALNRAYGWNELRSDWYRVSLVDGRVVFDGRGHGHGVGLCQAGARFMAAQGKGYREILGFYFPGTRVRVLAGDAGWTSRQGNGWELRAVRAGNEWVRAGDAAWVKARAAFPVQRPIRPLVTVSPTTELFREATGEPGWELAATRSIAVAVQPETVVEGTGCGGGAVRVGGVVAAADPTLRARNRRDERATQSCGDALQELLVHEFLHVLVESEAGARAPLWLREGMVESLAGERCAAVRMPAAQIDAGLVEVVGTQAESQRAHAAACERVRSAVAAYGLPAVRAWLRSGVPAGGRLGE